MGHDLPERAATHAHPSQVPRWDMRGTALASSPVMLKGLLRWGGYAALFCAVSTVGQSIGFSNGINAGAVSQTVGSLLGKLPGTDMSKGGVIAAIPGAEQKTFAKTSQLIR